MNNAMAFLKKKGPLGMPMAFWAGFGAIVLYLGYRYFKKKGGGSSASSSGDTSGETTGGTATDSSGADTSGGAQPSAIDNTQPPESTTPGQRETTPFVSDGPGKTSADLSAALATVGDRRKKPKPKQHPSTHHDHKQGSEHTNKRHLPKPKSPNHHAPPTKKRAPSKEKAKVTAGVPIHPPVMESRRSATTTVAPPAIEKRTALKHPPAPPHYEAPHKETKSPPQKRRRG